MPHHMVEEIADTVLNASVMNKRFATLILEKPRRLEAQLQARSHRHDSCGGSGRSY